MFQTDYVSDWLCFRQNSNIKSSYVSDKTLILSLAMFSDKILTEILILRLTMFYVSDKILTETLILRLTMFQTKF